MGVDQALDFRSNSLRNIDEEHAMVHDGKLFTFQDTATGVANAAYLAAAIVIPAGVYPHVSFQVFSDQIMTITIAEGATYSGGSAGSVFNRNRVSTATGNCTIVKAVTSTDGTAVFSMRYPALTTSGFSLRKDLEYVFPPQAATKFVVFKATNNSGAATATIYMDVTWYEI